jgi:hypothetical protein
VVIRAAFDADTAARELNLDHGAANVGTAAAPDLLLRRPGGREVHQLPGNQIGRSARSADLLNCIVPYKTRRLSQRQRWPHERGQQC